MGNKASSGKKGGGGGGAAGGSTAAAASTATPASAGGAGGAGGDDETPPDVDIHTDLNSKAGKKLTVDDFDLLKVLGKGSFGKVMLVRRKGAAEDEVYAMKTLNKKVLLQRNQIAHTKTERAILQQIHHPYIVGLNAAFQSDTKLYLVTEFAAGGELFFWLKRDRRFSEARTKLYTAQIVLALEHLHERDIIYRDLKPENILLDAGGHIKITDFGLSKANIQGAGAAGGTKTFCGTPEYLAPEILEQKGHGKAVDWWSLGTLVYEMLNGLPPFYDNNMQRMYEKILHADLRFPPHFSRDARDLLRGMLERRVEDRLGSRGASEIKSHAWFADIDWEKVAKREVKPEFVPPKLESATDTRYFDKEFTSERPADTPAAASALGETAKAATHFEGFTYNPDSELSRD